MAWLTGKKHHRGKKQRIYPFLNANKSLTLLRIRLFFCLVWSNENVRNNHTAWFN